MADRICPDGGTCHHTSCAAGPCFRQQHCVPLSTSGRKDWELVASEPENERPAIGEAYETDTHVIVCGVPPTEPTDWPEDDLRRHNCDAMGCTSVSHVLYRFWRERAVDPVAQIADALESGKQAVDDLNRRAAQRAPAKPYEPGALIGHLSSDGRLWFGERLAADHCELHPGMSYQPVHAAPPPGTIPFPVDLLDRAVSVLERDGDEHGIAKVLRAGKAAAGASS